MLIKVTPANRLRALPINIQEFKNITGRDMTSKRFGVFIACILTWWSLSFSPPLFAQSPVGTPPSQPSTPAQAQPGGSLPGQDSNQRPAQPPSPLGGVQPGQLPGPVLGLGSTPMAPPSPPALKSGPPTLKVDKNDLDNGGTITVTGKGTPGQPVFLEVWSENDVRTSFFDSKKDKETGKIPYILYMTEAMPAYYRICVPSSLKDKLKDIEKQGGGWSYSQTLKDLGADAAYTIPGKIKIDRYQATLLGSIVGSRGDILPKMDDKENKKRSMQLVKARFRSPGKVLAPTVE
ncbi:MAG: hypothetical protein HQK56_14720, partial [Deltaproteobacteria bacterium]|nr:hypothetical protein [Deltaproteobacteria bacterium]